MKHIFAGLAAATMLAVAPLAADANERHGRSRGDHFGQRQEFDHRPHQSHRGWQGDHGRRWQHRWEDNRWYGHRWHGHRWHGHAWRDRWNDGHYGRHRYWR